MSACLHVYQFNLSAHDLLASVDRNAQLLHSSLTSLAQLYPSYADGTPQDASRTMFLTLRDWEAFARQARDMTGARMIAYAPLLLQEDVRPDWEAYAVAEQSWIRESASTFDDPDVTTLPETIEPIRPSIWLRDGSGQSIIDPGPTPYLPMWQVSPPPVHDTTPINFNFASDKRIDDWIELQLDQNTTWSFLSEPWNAGFVFGLENYPPEQRNEPGSLAWIPMVDSLVTAEKTLAGAIVADVPWSALLRHVSTRGKGVVIHVWLEKLVSSHIFSLIMVGRWYRRSKEKSM